MKIDWTYQTVRPEDWMEWADQNADKMVIVIFIIIILIDNFLQHIFYPPRYCSIS